TSGCQSERIFMASEAPPAVLTDTPYIRSIVATSSCVAASSSTASTRRPRSVTSVGAAGCAPCGCVWSAGACAPDVVDESASRRSCTGDASAGQAAFGCGRRRYGAQRLRPANAHFLQPRDGGALHLHLTLENLRLAAQISERIRRRRLAWSRHGSLFRLSGN